MEWLNKYKKIIISFCMSFAILGCSVFSPCLNVYASNETSIERAWTDENGDGNIDVNEVNFAQMLSFVFMRAGYWVDTATDVFADVVEQANVLFSGSSDAILGYLGSDGGATLSDNAWDLMLSLADYLEKNDGYTIYPAFPSDPYFYITNGSTFDESYTNAFIDSFGEHIENNAFVTKDSQGYYRILLPEEGLSSSDYPYSSDCNDYVYVRRNGSNNYFYIYYFNENGALTYAGYFDYCCYLSPYVESGWAWNSMGSSVPYFGGYPLLGFVGNRHAVFDSVESAYKYYSYDRSVYRHSHGGGGGSFSLDYLNGSDWEEVQNEGYSYLNSNLVVHVDEDDFDAEAFIEEFSEEFLYEFKAESEKHLSILERIYALLEKWLPNIGKGGDTNIDVDINTEEDDNKVNDFATNSDGQSNSLNDLNQQTDYEKVDVDSASTEVDENVDLEAVGSYGTLLSSFTSNEYVIYILLATLSIALVSYVLFGKR